MTKEINKIAADLLKIKNEGNCLGIFFYVDRGLAKKFGKTAYGNTRFVLTNKGAQMLRIAA